MRTKPLKTGKLPAQALLLTRAFVCHLFLYSLYSVNIIVVSTFRVLLQIVILHLYYIRTQLVNSCCTDPRFPDDSGENPRNLVYRRAYFCWFGSTQLKKAIRAAFCNVIFSKWQSKNVMLVFSIPNKGVHFRCVSSNVKFD